MARALVLLLSVWMTGCVELLVEAGAAVAAEGLAVAATSSGAGASSGGLRAHVTCRDAACGVAGALTVVLARCGGKASVVEIAAKDVSLGNEPRSLTFPPVAAGKYCLRASLAAGDVVHRTGEEVRVEIEPDTVAEAALIVGGD